MKPECRNRIVLAYGAAHMRSRSSAKKRIERLRHRIRAGGPVHWDGATHPIGCPCYDCGFGEVARERVRVAGAGGGKVSNEFQAYAETAPRMGRVSRGMPRGLRRE